MAVSLPERLGKYPITDVLGKGAMGVVYRGFDPVIKRPVAIKTIRKELIEDDEKAESLSARFRREAQAAGALSHPGIVAVYEYGEDQSFAYIAMEYVEGNSLREYLTRGAAFDERDTVSIMAQLLDALEFAHGRTVWHRDIKPANIIVMSNGRIKLTDFGIARIESAERTRTNVIMGTPGYIAPEIYLGGAVDHRLDIFAAGVLFYHLLAGQPPFRGRPEAVMHDVCYHDPEPPSEVDPGHRWPHYDDVVARALRKAPAARYGSAAEFRAAILAEYAQPPANTISEATIIQTTARPIAIEQSLMSQPRSMPLPGGGTSTPPPTGWSSTVLAGVEVELARFVGPVAKVLVRRAARDHKRMDDLVGALLSSIDMRADQEAFSRAVLGRLAAPSRVPAVAGVDSLTPVPSSANAAGPLLTADDLERATKLLVRYIGPIARVVTRRAATDGVSRRDFLNTVALSLDDETQRERFLREAAVPHR
jgi:serine/threonine protein kinase